MTDFDACRTAVGYYGVLGHEHVHWTGTEKRCDRPQSTIMQSEVYAFEELIAELGAVLLGAHLGYATEPRPDHVAYLASWRKALEDDPKVMWRAATAASKAVAYLTGKVDDRRSKP